MKRLTLNLMSFAVAAAALAFPATFASAGELRTVLIPEACLTNGIVSVRRTVTDAVAAAGFMPVILPDVHDVAREEAMLDRSDALLIFGALDKSGKRRNEFERRIIRSAARRKMPIVGFCHGLQVINLALGGTHHRNPTNVAVRIVHHGKESPYVKDCFHEVTVRPGSRVARALGSGTQVVNTSHNFSIDRLAEGFEVTATAPDGIIEAIEHKTLPIVAFQFHPERLSPKDPRFAALIRASLEGR